MNRRGWTWLRASRDDLRKLLKRRNGKDRITMAKVQGKTRAVKRVPTAKAAQKLDMANMCYPGALIGCSDFLLSTLAMTMTDLLEESLVPLGLRLRHYRLLRLLYVEGPQAQGSLGRTMQVDRTTVVALVDFLERLHLAKRTRCEDRRAYFVELTAKGKSIALDATERVNAVEAEIFAPLDIEERDTLRRLSTKLLVAPGPIAAVHARPQVDQASKVS